MDAGGREFRFRRDLYFQESTFPLVVHVFIFECVFVCAYVYECDSGLRNGSV